MKKIIVFLFVLTYSLNTFGQKNVFLDRNYWKQNPTLADVKTQIENGNDITELNANAFDPVCYALLEKANNEVIKYMLNFQGNGVNKITHDKRTYLFWAAYKGNLDMMDYLVQNGAKTNLRDSHGNTVMNFVANSGQLDTNVYDFLIKNGADPVTELTTNGANAMLLLAPYMKDSALIEYFTSKGISLKSSDRDGYGLFEYAARTVNKPILSYAIKKGIDGTTETKDGGNAFLLAVRGTRGKQNTLADYTYLASLGVSPKVTTKEGVTPLHYLAARSQDPEVIQYFLDSGVDVNQADTNGNTPFLNASSRNSLDVVKLLFASGADIKHQNKNGQTALSLALERNDASVVAYLLKQGADPTVIDEDGNSLAYYLVQSFSSRNKENFKKKAALLKGANINLQTVQSNGNTLFHLAVDKNDIELLNWVHQTKCDINAKNEEGLTALHKAVMSAKDATLVRHLISLGADISITTDFEESVYDLAQENELLTKNNIDLSFLK